MENRIVVLGSGTCVSSLYKPFDFRNPSCHLLQFNGGNILLDCGEGVRRQMDKIQFDYFDLDYVFITHFHPDHFDLDSLIQAIYIRTKKSGAKKSLVIYGPKTIEEKFEISWDIKHSKGAYRRTLLNVLDLKFADYEDKGELEISQKMICIPYKVSHGEMDAYALRFLLKDKIITYSGDSGVCDGLEKASQNADVFLCEATINLEDKENDTRSHLTYFFAGELAKKSKVKKLVLVHYTGKDSNEIMKQEVKKSDFTEEIYVSRDLDSFAF